MRSSKASGLAKIRLQSTDSEDTTHSVMTDSTVDSSASSSGYQNSYHSLETETVHSPISTKSIGSQTSLKSRGSRTCSPSPCASPVRMGNLAYLASRRSSRDSSIGDLPLASCRPRRTSNFLELPIPDHYRRRVCSLPEQAYNPRLTDELYRLRTFNITSKGVVNRGDALISRNSRSNTSVCSTASSVCQGSSCTLDGSSQSFVILQRRPNRYANHYNKPLIRSGRTNEATGFDTSCCGSSYVSSKSSSIEVPQFRVVLMGDSGVGKTALVNQCMSSDYMNTYDISLDDEFGERTVSVLLDEEENEITFIDHPADEMSAENSLATYEPHAVIVVYSITDRFSFKKAEDILNYLWAVNFTKEFTVILVANKVDLARSRVISDEEGKTLATNYEAKYIETAVGLQHNVDELLVGVIKQIRLRKEAIKKRKRRSISSSKTVNSLRAAKDILSKMCNVSYKSKSCDNLHVL